MRRWEEAPRTFERRTTSKYTFSLVSPFCGAIGERGRKKRSRKRSE